MKGEVAKAARGAGPVAAIEIGSTGIRLLIASIDAAGGIKVIDRAESPAGSAATSSRRAISAARRSARASPSSPPSASCSRATA